MTMQGQLSLFGGASGAATVAPAPFPPIIDDERRTEALEWLSGNDWEFQELEEKIEDAEHRDKPDRAYLARLFAECEDLVRLYLTGEIGPEAEARCATFEEHLRELGVPYVVVEEVTRRIFPASDIDPFDFLVYSESGPNLLVLVREATGDSRYAPDERSAHEADVALLAEWEKVFGGEFVGAFAFGSPNGWRCITSRDFGLSMNALHVRPFPEFL